MTLRADWSIGRIDTPTPEEIATWEECKLIVSGIADGLYVSGFPFAAVQRQMKSEGIDTLVSCTVRRPPDLHGVLTLRAPFVDNLLELPDPEFLLNLAKNAGELYMSGRRVLIHCAYGLNRSPLVAAQTLKYINPSIPGKDIYSCIKEKRPAAFHNQLFGDYVKAL